MAARHVLIGMAVLLACSGCTPALFVSDAGEDAGLDAGARDASIDAPSFDAGADAGTDGGPDAGPCGGWTPRNCDTPQPCGSLCVTRCQQAVSAAEARSRCEGEGGCLARIRNAADSVCLDNLFVGGMVWIGGEQIGSAASVDEGWEWHCGAARQSISTAVWAAGQPNDADSTEDHTEDCAVFDGAGTGDVADEICTVNHYFVCMRPIWK